MRSKSVQRRLRKVGETWLLVSVHLHSLRTSPKAYLTAAKWWVRRRRVRARGQLAPLLSRSPNAYRLWALRQARQEAHPSPKNALPTIVALVKADVESGALRRTLRNLSEEGLTALVIGSPETPGLADAAAQIDWSDDPWVMPIAAGDTIAAGAAAAYRDAIGDPALRIVYADDDHLGRWGRRDTPHFKPDWNSELFHFFDYLTNACIVRTSRRDLEALADTDEWAQQLVEAAAAQAVPLHLHRMLHHRGDRRVPLVPGPPAFPSDGQLPSVSIIVPTRNHLDMVRACLDGVAATRYPDIEVIVVDNDSDDPGTLRYLAALPPSRCRVLRHAGAFNYSAINNAAVAQARGRLVCLLNNDIEVIDPHWLATMAVQAIREDVGAVGARLLYPDGRIQHAGVVIGVGNAAGHAHRFLDPDEQGYFRRHALPQFTAAVTAACLVVQRDRFLAVGGLDESNFPVAFNDVDLCLRLNQRGWQSLYEPRATLIHHESVSRGLDLDPVGAARFAAELAALKLIWGTDSVIDPYHHPHLSRASEQFAVAI
jgi:GT2 family glycosyltransferase